LRDLTQSFVNELNPSRIALWWSYLSGRERWWFKLCHQRSLPLSSDHQRATNPHNPLPSLISIAT